MEAAVLSEVTAILERFEGARSGGDEDADRLTILVNRELRGLVGALRAREPHRVEVRPASLVNAAYVRLATDRTHGWKGRAYFLAIASRCLRQLLSEVARATRGVDRTGPGLQLDASALGVAGSPQIDAVLLDDALDRFAGRDPRAARVAEMRLFSAMNVQEIATALAVAPRVVDRELARVRLWLLEALTPTQA